MSELSNYLSEEIAAEILKRLPVKSVLRFTSVCKSWYFLITNPNFISLHLAYTTKANKTYSLVAKSQKFVLHRDDDSFSEYKELDLTSFHSISHFEIICSCNGLICLSDNKFGRLILWNPAIRELITASFRKRYHCSLVFIGFGFDIKNNGYKVVRISYDYSNMTVDMHFSRKLTQPLVEIFELSSNAWKTVIVKNLNCALYDSESGAYLNGALHWLAEIYCGFDRKIIIASFDLSNKAFGEFMFPRALAEISVADHLSLTVYDQSLAVIQYEELEFSMCYAKCCIWVMKEYGAPESWTKLFTINLEHYGGFDAVLSFQENGGILVGKSNGDIASYDPETQRVTPLHFRGYIFKVHSYVESLMLLKGKKNKKNQLVG